MGPELQANFRAASRALGRRLDEISEAALSGTRQIAARFDALDEQELREALERAGHAELASAVGRLRAGRGDSPALTVEAESLAMVWARDGAPVGGLIELCRVWHRALSDAWLGYLAQVPSAREWEPSAVQAGVRFFFDYFAGVAALLATAYTLNMEAMRRARSQRQLHLVQDVLAGRTSGAAGIPYDLSLVHTGFIAWGTGAATAGRLMRAEVGHTVLAVAASDDIVWGWVGSRLPIERGLLRKLARPLANASMSLAFGRAASGVEGFRLTHEQAREAQALARTLDMTVTLYEDVALEVLASADPERARRFVADELGPLADPGPRLERLRETLDAYFAASLNANAAAARLGVHDQTVSYRLRRIEELIGHPIYQRRAELELALRLGRALA